MPMTSIEKFHWFDSDPKYPNVVFCRMRVAGKLDEQTSRDAWQIVVDRQPLGDVRPEKKNGRWSWVAGPRAASPENQRLETWEGTRFTWDEFDQVPKDWQIDEHRIKSPTGSFLGVATYPNPLKNKEHSAKKQSLDENESLSNEKFVSEIWLYVHHAIGDGAGSSQCVNDWMTAYANLVAGKAPDAGLHRLDPDLLKTRNSLGLLTWRYLKHLWKQPVALFGAAKFVFRNTAELLPGKNSNEESASGEKSYPNILGEWIAPEQVKRLSQHAKSNDVMLNSVLLGQFYGAIIELRTQLGNQQPDDWLRIILPMSIRSVSDRRLPVANRATLVQIDRCEKDMQDLKKFYQLLNREIMIIRGWQLDKIFLILIRMLSAFEPLLRRAAGNGKSRGLAVFTNLGEPLRKSERNSAREPDSKAFIRPYEFDCTGPIRHGTPINLTISRYAKRIRVSMQYDRRAMDEDLAKGLLKAYCDRLNSIE